MIECDRLAELELPRSELQQMIDETSLPSCQGLSSTHSTCYLAEISIRRLLNRIHNSLYPRKSRVQAMTFPSLMAADEFSLDEISSMSPVCDELRRQLDLWHASIPEHCRPPISTDIIEDERIAILRIRYFAARHIIYRPFALYIATHSDDVPQNMTGQAAICIESCRLYLHCTSQILQRSSQYTWTFSLSCVLSLHISVPPSIRA
jgi:hypothetical protein